jgi:hypothetical protein
MKLAKRLGVSKVLFATSMALWSWLAVSPSFASAQKGYNAVWNSNLQGSSAFIDASAYNSSGDFCQQVSAALAQAFTQSLPGVVIDGRGVQPSGGYTCANPPGYGVSAPGTWTVLLPAGIISISNGWTFTTPKVKLVGEGVGLTTLQAASSFTGSTLIVSGSGTICASCYGADVQDLTLDGGNNSSVLYGINVAGSGSSSPNSVQRVSITNVEGTGMLISAPASGPYSDITVSGVNTSVCVQITASGTLGIHGLTCSGSGSAAVRLDGSSNFIGDVSIASGFTDGILVGAGSTVSGSVLFNITGGGANTIHISGTNTVTDLSVMGATKGTATHSLQDDATSTTLTDANVGIYVLGSAITLVGSGGSVFTAHSRFTTSSGGTSDTGVTTWAVGNSSPVGGCSGSAAPIGSLFSTTTGTPSSPPSLSVCKSSGWTTVY